MLAVMTIRETTQRSCKLNIHEYQSAVGTFRLIFLLFPSGKLNSMLSFLMSVHVVLPSEVKKMMMLQKNLVIFIWKNFGTWK